MSNITENIRKYLELLHNAKNAEKQLSEITRKLEDLRIELEKFECGESTDFGVGRNQLDKYYYVDDETIHVVYDWKNEKVIITPIEIEKPRS